VKSLAFGCGKVAFDDAQNGDDLVARRTARDGLPLDENQDRGQNHRQPKGRHKRRRVSSGESRKPARCSSRRAGAMGGRPGADLGGDQPGSDDGEKENGGDHRQRKDDGNLVNVHDEHLDADETEHEGQADLQINELFHHASQHEIQGAKPQDGEDVGGVNDKRVLGDGEDRRDGVDGENHVRRLDDDEDHHQERGVELAVFTHEEALAVIGLADRHQALEQAHHRVFLRFDFLVALKQHLDSGYDEEAAENVDHPVKGAEQRGAGGDEDRAQDQSAQNAPEQDPVLKLRRCVEVLKDHQEDKQVVHAEGLFDQVAGEKFQGFLLAPGKVDPEIENQRQRDPYDAPDRSFLDRDRVRLSVKDAEVEGEHPQDKNIEDNPQ